MSIVITFFFAIMQLIILTNLQFYHQTAVPLGSWEYLNVIERVFLSVQTLQAAVIRYKASLHVIYTVQDVVGEDSGS